MDQNDIKLMSVSLSKCDWREVKYVWQGHHLGVIKISKCSSQELISAST